MAIDRHRNRAITPRPPEELRERVQAAVTEAGTDVNALVIGLLRFWIGDTDEPPKRPVRSN
jgi:hypothetical protein